jgi:hypothetical protein
MPIPIQLYPAALVSGSNGARCKNLCSPGAGQAAAARLLDTRVVFISFCGRQPAVYAEPGPSLL